MMMMMRRTARYFYSFERRLCIRTIATRKFKALFREGEMRRTRRRPRRRHGFLSALRLMKQTFPDVLH
jgi:hypothetical protein